MKMMEVSCIPAGLVQLAGRNVVNHQVFGVAWQDHNSYINAI